MLLLLYIRISLAVAAGASIAYSYVDNNTGIGGLIVTCILWALTRIITEAVEAAVLLGFIDVKK